MNPMHDARIDSVRLGCNLLIVVAHVWPFVYILGGGGGFWMSYFLCRSVALTAMPALFILSGYLLFRNYDAVGYKAKFISRLCRLGIPLVVWDAIYIAVYNLAGLVAPSAYEAVVRLKINTLNGILEQFDPTCNLAIGPFWYVRAVLVLSAAAPIWRWMYDHVHWAILLSACIFVTITCDNIISHHYPMYGISLFLLGGLLAHRGVDIVEWFAHRRKVLVSIGLVVLLLGFVKNVIANDMSEPYGIFKFAGVMVIWGCADYLHLILSKKWIISYVLPAGFMIYAAHAFIAQITLHSVGRAICGLHFTWDPAGLSATFICFALTVASCIIFWHSGIRLCPQMIAILDGKIRVKRNNLQMEHYNG